MKINDVVLQEAANTKANWTDALKRFSNWAVGSNFQVSADQIDKKAKNDAIVDALAEAYADQWENVRIQMQKEWNNDVHPNKSKRS